MPRDYEDLYGLHDADDEEIYDLILEQLGEYPEIDPGLIDVQVEDGFVTLSGRVGTEQELQTVEHILSDVLGIANYSNELVVDELVRGETDVAADDAIDEELEAADRTGARAITTTDTAAHLLVDLEAELYGTHDLQDAIERGEAYEAPDRPVQEGSWSEEDH
jgi:hypothetical protein